MPTRQTDPLITVARAAAEGRAPDDAPKPAEAPETGDLPIGVRLDFAVLLTGAERAALQRPDSPFGPLPELPAVLYAAWRIRIDLNRAFDLSTSAGYAGLWVWAMRDGRREIDVLAVAVASARPILATPVSPPGGGSLPVGFPWTAALLWCARPDLQDAYPVSNAQNAATFLGWFLRHGVFELRCGDLLPDDHVALLAGPSEAKVPPPLTRYLEFANGAREDLRSAFDLNTLRGRLEYIKWFFDHGKTEFPAHPDILAHQTRIVTDWGNAVRKSTVPPPSDAVPQDGTGPEDNTG